MNSTLNNNFDFFNYTPVKVSNARKLEIESIKENNIIKNTERLEKRIKRERYNKSLAIRLG